MSQEGAEEQNNPCRVFIGNLKFNTADETLQEILAEAGNVVSAEMIKSGDGRSRGCAVAEFSTAEEADRAKELLTDREVEGRKIFVREDRTGAAPKRASKPRARRTKKPAAERNGDQPREPRVVREAQPNQLFVRNIPFDTTEDELKQAFAEHGAISADLKTRRNGQSKGFGLVQFSDAAQAANALEACQRMMLGDRELELREDRPPRPVAAEE